MSCSLPNSRAPSPPPAPAAAHGGYRPTSGKKSKKRRNAENANAAGNATQEAMRQHRQRLSDGISSLSNSSGRSLSANELRIIIRLALWLQLHEGYTEAAAVEAASVWAGSSRCIVAPAYQHWWETGELLEPDTSQRGRGNPHHPLHEGALTAETQQRIHAILAEARLTNAFVPAREVMRRAGLHVSERHARRLLRRMGYKWRRKRPVGTASKEQMAQRMRSFIHLYSDSLQQEENGVAIIVRTDESYIHTQHRNRFLWAENANPEGAQVRGAASKGKRLILLHAMTREGLLIAPRRGRSVVAPNNVVSDEALDCELIFEGLVDSEDYHKNMNGTVFMQWVVNRLIPTFKRCFPGKKLILVLDNAAYHHPRGPDWVNPNKMKKEELAAWIVEHLPDGELMRVQDDGRERVFGKAALFAHASKYAPTCHLMRRWVKAYLQRHPGTNQTLLQQEFARHGFQLLYTPPYQCDTQPIEMLWAYVKNYVGRVMGDDHSVAAVTQLTRQGFYGDEANNHAPADAAFCQRLIEHTHKWLNAWIKRDEELSGDIRHLDGAVAENDDVWDDLDDAEEDQTEASSDEDSD